MTKAQELMETTYRLARAAFLPHEITGLIRAERQLHRLDERQANGDGWGPGEWANGQYFRTWTEKDDATVERKEKAIYKRVDLILLDRNRREPDRKPLALYHQGDCRGGSLYLIDADLKEPNCNYTRGICV